MRAPAVSGRFYPGTRDELERTVRELLDIKPVETIDEVLELALLEPHPLRPLAVRARTSGQTEARP